MTVIPWRRQFRKPKNTKLARQLAEIYEKYLGPFPGGVENAYIKRLHPGHWQRSQGAFSWVLMTIDDQFGHADNFASQFTAKEAVKDPFETIVYGFWDEPLSNLALDEITRKKYDIVNLKPPKEVV